MSRLAIASAVALTTAEAGTLKLTYSDCGSKHGHVDSMSPTTFSTGEKVTITGTGTIDEDISAVSLKATISALGTELTSCQGDGTSDIVCALPLNTGSITIPKLSLPLAKGTLNLPVIVETSQAIPASLASVDIHLTGTDQAGESAICLDAHTDASTQIAVAEPTVQGSLKLTYSDCGSKHGHVDSMSPTTFSTGEKVTITGTGTIDEDISAVTLKATISALGTELTSCQGDGTSDIVCALPLNTGSITVPKLPLPLAKGTLNLPVIVETSQAIPASLASVDIHLTGSDQAGESAICLDAHTDASTQIAVAEPTVQGSLALTYSDCGSKHGHVDSMSPTTFSTGEKVTITGTGTIDEDISAVSLKATISALGTELTSCQGDGTSDIVCALPLNTGSITIPKLSLPLAKGTLNLPVIVETSEAIPASLASVDIHLTGTDQAGESAICLDAHTDASGFVIV